MPDSDATLKLLIQMGVVGREDVRAANDLLKETAASTTGTALATDDLGKAAKTAGESAEGLNKHVEGSRLLFTEINHIVPELGHLMHAAFEGPVGAAILLGIAVSELKGYLKEYNEELDKQADDAYQPHIDALKAIQGAWDESAQHAADYWVKVRTAGEDQNPLETARKNLEELDKLRAESAKKEIAQQALVMEAYVRTNGARRGLSKAEIEREVGEVKERAKDATSEIGNQAAQASIAVLQTELATAQALLPQLAAATVAAQAAAEKAKGKYDTDEAEKNRRATAGYGGELSPAELAKYLKEHPDDPRNKLADAQQELNTANEIPLIPKGDLGFSEADRQAQNARIEQERRDAQAAVDAAQREVDQNKRIAEELRKNQSQRDAELDAANAAREKAETALRNAQEVINKNPAIITQKQTEETVKTTGEKQVAATGAAGKEVEYGIDLARSVEAGKATPGQIQDLLKIAAQMAGHAVDLNTAVGMMEAAARNTSAFQNLVGRLVTVLSSLDIAKINALAIQVDRLEAQMGATGNNHTSG